MTSAEPRPRSLLRIALAVVVVVDLVSFCFFIVEARATAPASALTGFNEACSRWPVLTAIVAIGAAGAIAFARRPGRLWEGLLPLAALTVLSTVHAQLFGSPWRHLYYSGLCLSGWLLGLAVSRVRGAATDESFARVGSIALLGAAYLNAGISKVAFSGVEWLSGLPIQAVVVGQDGLVRDSIVSGYRSWVADTPAAASLFAIATVGFELAAPLMLAGRRTRTGVALGLLGMHANIYVLTRILYWESMVLLALLGFSADPPEDTAPLGGATAHANDRRYRLAVAALAACAFLAVAHQSRRFAEEHRPHRAPAGVAIAGTAAAPSPVRRIGPFVVGEALPDGWSVDALDVTRDGFTVGLSGSPGTVRFEVTCAASEHRSPFDLGAAHIFHSNGLAPAALKAVGASVQDQVRRATDGLDVCDEVERWRASTQ